MTPLRWLLRWLASRSEAAKLAACARRWELATRNHGNVWPYER